MILVRSTCDQAKSVARPCASSEHSQSAHKPAQLLWKAMNRVPFGRSQLQGIQGPVHA